MKFHPAVYFGLALLPGLGRALGAGYQLDLTLSEGKKHQEVTNHAQAAHRPLQRREVVEGGAASDFSTNWKITRTSKVEAEDVLVHFYVVTMDRRGQAPPALDPKRVVIESALTMDFPEGETAIGSPHFRVDGPGVYLVRVEVAPDPQAAGADPHASANAAEFIELELVVK
jgi:hypothetical protein